MTSQEQEGSESDRIAALEARVIELEIGASFERQSREALDEVVREFAVRVEGLERRLGELGERIGVAGIELGPEPPPE